MFSFHLWLVSHISLAVGSKTGELEKLSSMRQSGGVSPRSALVFDVSADSQPISSSAQERSVATMLFLLCLQSVTDTPFRVVDEINQGMDPTNERMVFDRIVRSSESGNEAPQYFLVTPKLLPNLSFSDQITVHFVCGGCVGACFSFCFCLYFSFWCSASGLGCLYKISGNSIHSFRARERSRNRVGRKNLLNAFETKIWTNEKYSQLCGVFMIIYFLPVFGKGREAKTPCLFRL